jgi:hypothetical protein
MEQDCFSLVSTMFSRVIAVSLFAFSNTGKGCHAIVEVTTKPDYRFILHQKYFLSIKIFSVHQDFPSPRITILPV